MKIYRGWVAPAMLATLLAAVGLGYAHLQLESISWAIRVAAGSIWRVAAGNLTASLLHAGFLLLPVAIVALVLAKGIGGSDAKN